VTRQLTAGVAVPSQCYLAEGPVWDPAARVLRWVDINPGHVHAFDPSTARTAGSRRPALMAPPFRVTTRFRSAPSD
jgi:sugar lactone lactonase YvrE